MRNNNSHGLKNVSLRERQAQDTKEKRELQLRTILYARPITRRMAATEVGYPDQTFMVTQNIFDLIVSGRAQVVGKMRCERSGHFAEAITTNPKHFIKPFNTTER